MTPPAHRPGLVSRGRELADPAPAAERIRASMSRELRPRLTLVATLLGGIVGGFVFGYVMSSVVIPRLPETGRTGLTEAAWALQALDVGIVVGAAVAVAIAFRNEPPRMWVAPTMTLLIAGVLVLAAALLEQYGPWWLLHPLTLLVLSPVLALLGRFVAARIDHQDVDQMD